MKLQGSESLLCEPHVWKRQCDERAREHVAVINISLNSTEELSLLAEERFSVLWSLKAFL